MKDNLLIVFALIKTLFEEKKDYIDTFCPFILKIINENKKIRVQKLQGLVYEKFNILIPENTLKTILIRAKKRKLIDENEQLTLEGLIYVEAIEKTKDVDRKINELLEDLKGFIGDKRLSTDQVSSLLFGFINKNLNNIVEYCYFFNEEETKLKTKNRSEHDKSIIEYFQICDKRKPQLWETLKDIVLGSIISISPCAIDINVAKKKFRNVTIYMDSNFLFSILNLHPSEFCRPAKELLNFLKKFNFKLKVFDFTLQEINRVLNNAILERKKYIKGIRINSIYSVVTEKELSEIDIINKIREIPQELEDLDIKIEITNINVMDYTPTKEDFEVLKEYKDIGSHYSINHDIVAIKQIAKIRGSKKRKIEESVAFFLSSDLKLSKANYEKMSHKEDRTITEVIPDILLTNILSLKDPES